MSLFIAAACIGMQPWDAGANNISVADIGLRRVDSTKADVQFDISWENSWRVTNGPCNWDAAWVFVKHLDANTNWQHATLAASGHKPASGSTIDIGFTTNRGAGAFIYRDAPAITGLVVQFGTGCRRGLFDG